MGKPAGAFLKLSVMTKMVVVMSFWYVGAVAQESRFLIEKQGKDGCIDLDGKVVIQAIYKSESYFHEGFSKEAFVSFYWRWYRHLSYLNPNGDTTINTDYSEGGKFSEGLVAIEVGGFWGSSDTTGAIVIKPRFTIAHPFLDGLAEVETFYEHGYIDHKGNFVWQDEI
jgi:hypothetical protein